jgi:hypothetical protein
MAFYEESSYGVFASGGATLFPRLFNSNSWSMRQVPLRQVIRTADAGNRPIQVVAGRRAFQGTLNTLLYPSQAAYLATMITPVSNILPSYSIEWWDSVQAWRFLGFRAQSLTLTGSATQDYWTCSLTGTAQDRDGTFTTFAQPAQSVYPTEVPYQYIETAGNCTIATTAFTKYKTLTMKFDNVLVPTWDEQPTITDLIYAGRDFTFTFGPQYLATTYRGDYSAQTALAFVLDLVRASPSHGFSVNCQSSTYFSNVADDLPLDGPGYQNITGQVFFDKTGGTDFAITAT